VIAALEVFPLVHCCAGDVPYRLLRAAGAKAISVDASLIPQRADDAIGESIDGGMGLFLGVVPGTDVRLPALGVTVRPVRELWRRLGFPAKELSDRVVLTPACGLAGGSPGYVRAALERCREAARMLSEAPE
jgi:methionine synthase II (cobalamin-independent)